MEGAEAGKLTGAAGAGVADLTRGGIPPQVTVTADADWLVYRELWWSDLHMTTDTSPDAERNRRRRRLARIAADVLTTSSASPAVNSAT